jgi:hypothetical protein
MSVPRHQTVTPNLKTKSTDSRVYDPRRTGEDNRDLGLGHARRHASTTLDTTLGEIIDTKATTGTEREVGRRDTMNEIDMATTHLETIDHGLDPGHRVTIMIAAIKEETAATDQQDTRNAPRTIDTTETTVMHRDMTAAGFVIAIPGQIELKAIETINADENIPGHYRVRARPDAKNAVDFPLRHRLVVRHPRRYALAVASPPGKTQVHLVQPCDLHLVHHHQSTSMHFVRCLSRRNSQTGKKTPTPVQCVRGSHFGTWVSPPPLCRLQGNCWRWTPLRIKPTKSEQTRQSGERRKVSQRKRVAMIMMTMMGETRTDWGKS